MLKLVGCFAAILLIVSGPLVADSLWTQGSGASLAADPKARAVGDLITLLVVEQTTSSQQASTDFKKDLDHKNGAGIGPLVSIVPDVAFKSAQSSSASGQTTMTNNLVTRLTATVKKVLANGNLEVAGERVINTNSEKQTMTITATVRPQDIASDNTVPSTLLADVSCSYSGKGPVGDRQREGVISKILKYIF